MVTQKEIAQGLQALGLKTGNIVLLHSSLASLGHVEGGADAVVDAFLDVLGPEGTLVVPVFEAGLGIITEVVKGRAGAVCSIHPWACVAALGRDAEELCREHWKAPMAHTEDTPYMRIAAKGGYVCLLGADQDRSTTLHTVEALLRLPYLQETQPVTFDTPEGKVTKTWPFFPGPHRDFIGLDPALRASGRMRMGRIGDAVVRLMRSQDLIDVTLELGRRDPAFVLCDNPNCPDCVAQRADLRRAAFARESFRVVAASGLAGRYAEEIADNCRAAGIEAVELDTLRGRPFSMLSPAVVEKSIAALREEKIEVTALRSWSVPQNLDKIQKLAAASGVKRLVLPLSHLAAEQARAAAEQGLALSFFNSGMDSDLCSALLLDLKQQGTTAHFAFNGANFARAGELPFLVSYKKKLRRFVDQVDVEDATYSGCQQALACGNAELKEMISILRCASFPGYLSLTSRNRTFEDLLQTAKRLERLLHEM